MFNLTYITSAIALCGIGYYIYPNKIKSIIVNIGYDILSIYTSIEINYLIPLQDYLKIEQKNEDNNKDYFVIINNNKYRETYDIPNDYTKYDSIIHKNSNNTCCIYHTPLFRDIKNNYELCDYKFISMTVEITNSLDSSLNKSLNVKLQEKNYNYYVVNNEIDSDIIWYLIHEQFNIYSDLYDKKYIIHLIDQNVGMFVLTNKDKILLNKTEYKIIKNN